MIMMLIIIMIIIIGTIMIITPTTAASPSAGRARGARASAECLQECEEIGGA